MPVEVLNFDLSQRGTPVGTHVLRTELRGNTVHMEARLQLSGSLGRSTITQTSRSHARQHHSLAFREEQQKRGDNRVYDVQFDRSSGLVKASKGKDRAEEPLVRPYRDPLGMLFEIRQLDPEATSLTIPMLGKAVVVTLVTTTLLETAVGPRPARIYRLFPGGTLLWVAQDEPHVILQMQQRIDGNPVDVVLTGVASEKGSTREARPQAQQGKEQAGRRSRSRRGRRRRRRQD